MSVFMSVQLWVCRGTSGWVVISGGIHGVHIAVRLLEEAGLSRERLGSWTRRKSCSRAGSPVHKRRDASRFSCRSLTDTSLVQYAKARKTGVSVSLLTHRPPDLRLFNEHCDALIDACDLASLHVRARAVACTVENDGVVVALSDGTRLTSRNVVLALGQEAADLPDWRLAAL